jgi:hypothetical protein
MTKSTHAANLMNSRMACECPDPPTTPGHFAKEMLNKTGFLFNIPQIAKPLPSIKQATKSIQ